MARRMLPPFAQASRWSGGWIGSSGDSASPRPADRVHHSGVSIHGRRHVRTTGGSILTAAAGPFRQTRRSFFRRNECAAARRHTLSALQVLGDNTDMYAHGRERTTHKVAQASHGRQHIPHHRGLHHAGRGVDSVKNTNTHELITNFHEFMERTRIAH